MMAANGSITMESRPMQEGRMLSMDRYGIVMRTHLKRKRPVNRFSSKLSIA